LNLLRIVVKRKEEEALRKKLLGKAEREAEAGRRLAMYDRQTGLYAYWYVCRRFEEEAKRSQRYHHPLTAIVIEVARDQGFRTLDRVTEWLSAELRASDFAAHLGDGRYVVLLPETDLEAAGLVVRRMRAAFAGLLKAGVSRFPDDGKSLQELQDAAGRDAAVAPAATP
jgi:diguanylate cyclase (GGDEF)-like protein